MSVGFMKRTLRGWEAADEETRRIEKRFSVGDIAKVKITRPRNYQHHKLCMALLSLTFSNQERYTDFRMFRRAVAYDAGLVHEYVTLDGEVHIEARSLSYDEIDQTEFDTVFPVLMHVCATRFLGGMDQEQLRAEVEQYAHEHFASEAA